MPLFTEVVRLKREAAQALGQKLGLKPYDAFLDEFEPGERSASIAPLFARLRAFLPGIIEKAVERQAADQVSTSQGPFPLERQQRLASEILRIVGFDFNRGRLDLAPHPFCSSIPTDVRITARFARDDYVDGLMIVLHESGHGRYQQGLPSEWLDQPVGAARSTCLHEGQAILTEMQLGRSRAFLEFLAPLIAKAFPDAAARDPRGYEPDNLFRQLSRVKPGLIRVAADGATYPCHVVLRFELEQALIDGSLMPANLPEAWNEGMREMLGLETLGNDRDGCMQDLHWPCGMFGYFPTYTVGALMAAQLFSAIERDSPDLDQQIRRGELGPLNSWLREHVWSQGSVESGMALVARATGRPLGTEAFEHHLKRRYLLREA